MIIYNKDIFDKVGVAYPKDGMTWPDQPGQTEEAGGVVVGISSASQHKVTTAKQQETQK